MKIKTLSLSLALLMNLSSFSALSQDMTDIRDGADIMKVDITRAQYDALPNLVYSQIHSSQEVRELHMSLLVPRTNDLKPAILYFPGGGFITAKYNKYIEMRSALAEAGFVVAAVEYRVVPNVYPAPVIDAKSAVRYLRSHAKEYGINPNRIGVVGDSAGGWLSQMMGTTNGEQGLDVGENLNYSSDVQAAATIYGISNLLNIGEGFGAEIDKVHESLSSTESLLVYGPAFRTFAGASIMADKEKALNASPMGHIHGKKPPFLIMHGDKDTLVSPIQSYQLFKALKAENNQVDYVVLEGAEHGDIHWFQKPVIQKVVQWFEKNLGKPTKNDSLQAKDKNSNL
ncbi:alpha/beta hydrolase [Vibrio viridaestus]|uniref:Alpha/beta hydrolase n=1 Tax=Vibrio viridaestus TaxID=2487322 RepID=A0A3N9TM64_9VIBR|nr:alpha/beta hydrolase [Vibrio viridaestus]RQW65094.1 alpha/beta hydrolase [Vibrio viridaestus]